MTFDWQDAGRRNYEPHERGESMADDPQVDPMEKLAASHVEYRRLVVEGINEMIFPRDEHGRLIHSEVAMDESERLNAFLERFAIQLQTRIDAQTQVQDPPPVEPDPINPHDPQDAPAPPSSPPQGSDQGSGDSDDSHDDVTRLDLFLEDHPRLKGVADKVRPRAAKLWHHHGDKLERGFTP